MLNFTQIYCREDEMNEKIMEMLFQAVGGLGIFLFGMNAMSDGMQKLAGEKLKKIIGAVTNNKILAVGIGVVATGLMQSSSVTTVMVIGFVNAQLMNLSQALGVILGANIGTTVTGWLLVIDLIKYGLPIAGLASIALLFSKKEKAKIRASMIMGIGLVFFGLSLMSSGLKPMKDMPTFIDFFHKFDASTTSGMILCAFVGMLTTAVVQSSSATLGITIALATQGIIAPETGVALVLGENIGTTITAFLASLGASVNAKRAALAHFGFNFIGVIWVLSIFPFYIELLRHFPGTTSNVGILIVTAHTVFNISNVCLFIPFTRQYAKLLIKVLPNDGTEVEGRATKLDKRLLETPTIAMSLVKTELLNAGHALGDLFDKYLYILKEDSEKDSQSVKFMFEEEERFDLIQKEISELAKDALLMELPANLIIDAKVSISLADEYESISDYLLSQTKQFIKMKENGYQLEIEHLNELFELNHKVKEFFMLVNTAYKDDNINEKLFDIGERKSKLVSTYKNLKEKYLEKVQFVNYPVEFITVCIEILNNYRRMINHVFHMAEILAESKNVK